MCAVGADVKEVINGLEMSYKYSNVDENNTLVPQWIVLHAIALLKAQQPRVMTLQEVKSERIFWIEDADDGITVRLFPATMFGTGEYANGSKSCIFLAQKPWAIDVDNYEWWYFIEDYGETWRCWTSRPTDEQREAIPWERLN